MMGSDNLEQAHCQHAVSQLRLELLWHGDEEDESVAEEHAGSTTTSAAAAVALLML